VGAPITSSSTPSTDGIVLTSATSASHTQRRPSAIARATRAVLPNIDS